MHDHMEASLAIVGCIEEFQRYLNGIRHHHERSDGTGYPDGLQGDQIPLEGRIIAHAYDAMTSERAYRRRLSHTEALACSNTMPAASSPDRRGRLHLCCEGEHKPSVSRGDSGNSPSRRPHPDPKDRVDNLPQGEDHDVEKAKKCEGQSWKAPFASRAAYARAGLADLLASDSGPASLSGVGANRGPMRAGLPAQGSRPVQGASGPGRRSRQLEPLCVRVERQAR